VNLVCPEAQQQEQSGGPWMLWGNLVVGVFQVLDSRVYSGAGGGVVQCSRVASAPHPAVVQKRDCASSCHAVGPLCKPRAGSCCAGRTVGFLWLALIKSVVSLVCCVIH
jgi:hypothetical protein